MAYIGKKPEDAFRGLAYYDTFTGDGSTTTFDLSADAPDGGQNDITVVVDNVRQEPGATKSYTLGDDGSGNYRRITFNVAPDNGSEIYAINPGRSTQLNTVSDNAISAAKIQTDAVTTAKIQDDAVTNAKIGPAAVGATEISPGSITTTQISPSAAITNSQLANSSITINGNAVSLGGSITAGTDWQAVTVADGSTTLNAEAGKGYFLDTNAGTIDVNLPTSPTRGDTIVLADYGNNFATNRVIVNTGGKLIDSVVGGEPGSSGFTIETNGAVVELVFADDTAGWIIKQNNVPSDLGAESYIKYVTATGGTITTSGDFKIHTFTGDGCFVVSCAGNPAGSDSVDYLVVAGGGAGAGKNCGGGVGGGGAGGVRIGTVVQPSPLSPSPLVAPGFTISQTTYPISVGGGGACSVNNPSGTAGTSGSNSVFATFTAAGGGGGNDASSTGASGGSGGGGGEGGGGGGTGNTPPVSPPQGNSGGTGNSPNSGAGGGGFTQAGESTPPAGPAPEGAGGGGINAGPIFGTANGSPGGYFAGGGGGSQGSFDPGKSGGAGGGGTGNGVPGASTSGSANTGGGGGGHGSSGAPNGGTNAGGKGIVIIRYKFQ